MAFLRWFEGVVNAAPRPFCVLDANYNADASAEAFGVLRALAERVRKAPSVHVYGHIDSDGITGSAIAARPAWTATRSAGATSGAAAARSGIRHRPT